MKITLLPKLRLLFIQAFMTILMALPLTNAKANDNIHLEVNQKVRGTQKVQLFDVLSQKNIVFDAHQEVESLTVKVKGKGLISISSLDEHKGSIRVSKFHKFGKVETKESQIRDIDITINGKMKIETVDIQLKPLEAPL